ncbi:MAG: restriction endonuclease subunit M, partial [Bacteroidaceae bacterium]|nr:restriction endonuclease subunit M [Bacteroidaceae bacterium]
GRVIMPRVLKDKQLQIDRTKDKAEVFTPSWVCNAQNNLIDEAWFGHKDVFNHEVVNEDGTHSWIPTEGKIEFPEGDKQKTWKKYVTENRLEITCGEAPYLVSRYDTTTGESIPLANRIGLLDRKLRIVGENTTNPGEWLDWARKAYMHTYGYEWQGDNLLLAREALLYTFIEYYKAKFPDEELKKSSIVGIARIISWNLWQMDGIKMVVPDSCDKQYEENLWGEKIKRECKACKEGTTTGHIGVQCLIRDWSKAKPKEGYQLKPGEDPKSSPWQKLTFQSLLYGHNRTEDEEDA